MQAEPERFDARVRVPGNAFLTGVPQPTTAQWSKHAYWQKALPDMRNAYGAICAYCATWIPHSTGTHSVDHFIPKSQDTRLAYEWSNFRYVSARFNSRKGTRVILDPFELLPDWFVIDFKTFFIKPNADLSLSQRESVSQTVKVLHLNDDDDLVDEREGWFTEYRDGHISFSHLRKRAPFIAYEIERQKLMN